MLGQRAVGHFDRIKLEGFVPCGAGNRIGAKYGALGIGQANHHKFP